jgi:hypothetical protein
MRAALAAYFSRARCGQLSCADLAADLVGSLEGPSNVATDPKRLRGYGR